MSTILIATWDGGGNVPPALALGQELQARGHSVKVMAHSGQGETVTRAGLDFRPYRVAREFSAHNLLQPPVMIAMFGDEAMASEVAQEPADLVIVDCFLLAVMRALADRGRPYIALEHMFDSVVRAPNPLKLVLAAKGMRSKHLLALAEARIVATLPALDPVKGSNAIQTGPLVSGIPAVASEPTVLLSLSTFAFPGMQAAWQRALDAVATLPVHVIATTGPVINPASLRLGSNTEAHAWLPHADVMQKVSLVFGHGGHATTMLALAHHLPMVVMPMFKMSDQPKVGRALVRAGAARVVSKTAKPSKMQEAVTAVLTEPSYRANAAQLGEQIRELDGLRRAAAVVEQYTAVARPTARGQ